MRFSISKQTSAMNTGIATAALRRVYVRYATEDSVTVRVIFLRTAGVTRE